MVRVYNQDPMLMVADVAASLAYYASKLGFTKVGEHADDDGTLMWAMASRDQVNVMFALAHEHDESGAAIPVNRAPGSHRDAGLYFHVDDVDALYAELVERGAQPTEPFDQFYGQREICLSDPDGFMIAFAQRLPHE